MICPAVSWTEYLDAGAVPLCTGAHPHPHKTMIGHKNKKIKRDDISSVSVAKISTSRVRYMYNGLGSKFMVGQGNTGSIVVGLLDGHRLVAIKDPLKHRRDSETVLHHEAKISTFLNISKSSVPKIYGELANGAVVYELFILPELQEGSTKHQKGVPLMIMESELASDLCSILSLPFINQQVEPSHWIRIMIDISECVQTLHSSGYTHSDIKSDNVLIELADNFPIQRPKAKLTDFGYVYKANSKRFISDKPWYPPEQSDPRATNCKAMDIYSLGRLFTEILAHTGNSLEQGNCAKAVEWLTACMTDVAERRPLIEEVLLELTAILSKVERNKIKLGNISMQPLVITRL